MDDKFNNDDNMDFDPKSIFNDSFFGKKPTRTPQQDAYQQRPGQASTQQAAQQGAYGRPLSHNSANSSHENQQGGYKPRIRQDMEQEPFDTPSAPVYPKPSAQQPRQTPQRQAQPPVQQPRQTPQRQAQPPAQQPRQTPAQQAQPPRKAPAQSAPAKPSQNSFNRSASQVPSQGQPKKDGTDFSSYYVGRSEKVKNFSLNMSDADKESRVARAPAKRSDVFSYSDNASSGKEADYRELTRSMADADADMRIKGGNADTKSGDMISTPVRRKPANGSAKPAAGKKKRPAANRAEAAKAPSGKRAPANKPNAKKAQQGVKNGIDAIHRLKNKRYSAASALLGFACCVVFIVALTATVSSVALSTINDILAIKSSNEIVTVVVPEGAGFDEIMDIIADAKLIHQKQLCTLFAKLRNFNGYTNKEGKWIDTEYLNGVYYIEKDMGLEAILNSMKAASSTSAKTVKLSFPEGWSVAQIFEKLEKKEVCTAEKLYANLDIVGAQYDFFANLPDSSSRYLKLEGYLYPDTYDFFIGENANSVLKKLFNNFKDKWIDEYEQKRVESGRSLDEILTVASIIQREAKDKTQMAKIASIIYNRLDNSATYPQIQCDSTLNYAQKFIVPYVDDYNGQLYLGTYNTYSIQGLPPGPICNPGDDAIYAALNPEDTNYYYFCHSSTGELYCAATYEEQKANTAKVFSE